MNPLEDDEPLSRRGFVVGAVGAVGAGTAVAAGAPVLAQEDENGDEGDDNGENGDEGDDNGENGDDEEDENGGGAVETVSVVDDEFQPADLAIEPGTTVEWVWEGDRDHNIDPSSQPEGADWEGHPELQSDGTYEHTFDVEGTYDYVCTPHVGVGMTATIEVGEGASAAADGPIELVPDAVWTLVIASVAGMVSVLSLAYFFMSYGGESDS